MMLPEEDRLALKKDGYKMTANGVMPIAHPLQTHNRKSFSSEAQHRQGERDSLNNSRPIQQSPSPNLRGMSPDAAERWSAGSSLKLKPKATPTALNTRLYGSADAEERRHAGSSLKPKPKPVSYNRREWDNAPPRQTVQPTSSVEAFRHQERNFTNSPPSHPVSKPKTPPKPIPGTAADLLEAREALQQKRNSSQNLKKLNKGRIFDGELKDLQRETTVAEARVNASEAAKKLQDFPTQARRLKFNNRGITEELRSDLVQQVNKTKQRYMGTQGLDSSGQQIKLTPPPPLVPQQSKPEPKKSWWEFPKEGESWSAYKKEFHNSSDNSSTELELGKVELKGVPSPPLLPIAPSVGSQSESIPTYASIEALTLNGSMNSRFMKQQSLRQGNVVGALLVGVMGDDKPETSANMLSASGGVYSNNEEIKVAAEASLADTQTKFKLGGVSGNELSLGLGAGVGGSAAFYTGKDVDNDGYREYGGSVGYKLPFGGSLGIRVEPGYLADKAKSIGRKVIDKLNPFS